MEITAKKFLFYIQNTSEKKTQLGTLNYFIKQQKKTAYHTRTLVIIIHTKNRNICVCITHTVHSLKNQIP